MEDWEVGVRVCEEGGGGGGRKGVLDTYVGMVLSYDVLNK